MDKEIQDSVRALRAIWGNKVSNHRDTLISALEEDNFTSEERELCYQLIDIFNKKLISKEQIEKIVDANESTKEKEMERLENLISKGELELFLNDKSYIFMKNPYLNRLYKNQVNRILNEVDSRLEEEGWLNTSNWFEGFSEKLDKNSYKKIGNYLFDSKTNNLLQLDLNLEELNIRNFFKIENKINHISEQLGLIEEVKEAKKKIKYFKEKNLSIIYSSRLKKLLEREDFTKASIFVEENLRLNPSLKNTFDNVVAENNQKIQSLSEERIRENLKNGEFEIANELFERLPFKSRFKNEYIKLYSQSKILEIKNDIEKLDLDIAKKSLMDSKDKLDQEIFKLVLKEIETKITCKDKVLSCLEAHDFKQAYKINKDNSFLSDNDFSEKFLKSSLRSDLNNYSRKKFPLDAHQAKAISSSEKSIIITARAGSGKTTVILQRISMLVNNYNLSQSEILVLVFNRAVRGDIINRLVNVYGWDEKDAKNSIQTFHSFARKLILQDPDLEDLIFEDNKIKDILSTLFDKRIEEDLEFEQTFRLFMESSKTLKVSGLDETFFDSVADYHLFLRNQKYITLNNQVVKSHAEKYIADFLFEHDISYDYEQMIRVMDERVYRPDFKLWPLTDNGKKIYWEHWGIDENNPKTPSHWNQTADRYIEDMNLKRDFWKTQRESILIETSIVDYSLGRDSFEQVIKEKLLGVGIRPKKLSEEEISLKLKAIWRKPLINDIYQFVQKLSASSLDRIDIKQRTKSKDWISSSEERELLFYEMALVISRDYEEYKLNKKLMDFSDVLNKAMTVLQNADLHSDILSNPMQLKTVLIDEYQDFNYQFNEILLKLRQINPSIETFCVGDDWQAINSFMGADLRYFLNFVAENEDSISHNIPINYRSDSEIVEQGNKIMKGRGKEANSSKKGGVVESIYIEDSPYFDIQKDKRFDQFRRKQGENKNIPSFDAGFLRARYLKEMYKLLEIDELSNKTTLILTRRKDFLGVPIYEFISHLKRLFKEDVRKKTSPWKDVETIEEKMAISTVHSIKGGEADTVIVLGANEGSFPLLHPNNQLFRIFDSTPNDYLSKSLDEERRLFYVASTRAKETLYYLCEKTYISPFLIENNSFLNSKTTNIPF